jgi:tetratricopeptide (TPR) repeat protein
VTKQSRKELLKRDDAFLHAASDVTTWATKHSKPLVAGGVAVLLLVIVAWGAMHYMASRDRDASNIFAEGWRAINAEVVKPDDAKKKDKVEPGQLTFASEKERWTAARDAFQQTVDKAGYRGVGALAAFFVGDLSDRLGERDKAEASFAALRRELSPNDNLYFLAAERQAYIKEAQGDRDAALEALKEVASDDKRFYADAAQFHQARLYLAKGDRDKARSMLQHIDKAFPSSSLSEDVKAKLEELGGRDVAALDPAAPADANKKAAQ